MSLHPVFRTLHDSRFIEPVNPWLSIAHPITFNLKVFQAQCKFDHNFAWTGGPV